MVVPRRYTGYPNTELYQCPQLLEVQRNEREFVSVDVKLSKSAVGDEVLHQIVDDTTMADLRNRQRPSGMRFSALFPSKMTDSYLIFTTELKEEKAAWTVAASGGRISASSSLEFGDWICSFRTSAPFTRPSASIFIGFVELVNSDESFNLEKSTLHARRWITRQVNERFFKSNVDSLERK